MKNRPVRLCMVCLIFLTIGELWGCSDGDGHGDISDNGDGDNAPPAGGDPVQSSFDWDPADFDYVYDDGGVLREYNDNAAAVHIEEGDHIVIVGCELHDCDNGLFNSHLISNILIRQNYFHDNGIVGRIYEHNSYTESQGITFEFNRYGPLRSGCLGNNLKDRSSGTIIRYD